jgi:Arc/MetJ-type ribon-helix-helix transcriptional regulator
MPMELSERDRQLPAEYRRELDEQFKRKNRYKNGAEALEALRDLFESEEEPEAFGRYIRRMREEERARTVPE